MKKYHVRNYREAFAPPHVEHARGPLGAVEKFLAGIVECRPHELNLSSPIKEMLVTVWGPETREYKEFGVKINFSIDIKELERGEE